MELSIAEQIIALLDGYTIQAAREALKRADELLLTTQVVKRLDEAASGLNTDRTVRRESR